MKTFKNLTPEERDLYLSSTELHFHRNLIHKIVETVLANCVSADIHSLNAKLSELIESFEYSEKTVE